MIRYARRAWWSATALVTTEGGAFGASLTSSARALSELSASSSGNGAARAAAATAPKAAFRRPFFATATALKAGRFGTQEVVVSSPLDDDFAVMVHKNNVEERGPYWVGQTKWDNSWALWEGQGSKADVTAPVHNWAAEKVGDMVLDGRIFNFPIRKDLMHQYVRWQLAKLRQGTAKTMTRAEKRGGGRKPRKQKGSGMARIGSTRSPLMPGGGHAKAKSPKSWEFKLNKKVRRLALASALSAKAHEGRLLILDDMACSGKTREMDAWVSGNIVPEGSRVSVLLVDPKKEGAAGEALRRAAGNLRGVAVNTAAGLNVWQMLKFDYLVVSREAVDAVVARIDRDNLRGWAIRPAGYVSPWDALKEAAAAKRRELGLGDGGRRRLRRSAMDVAYRHRIELYPGQPRPQ